MSEAKVHEECSCGAVFDALGSSVLMGGWLRTWRDEHRHEHRAECGDRLPATKEPAAPEEFCDLRADHTGMHHAPSGTEWRYLGKGGVSA